MPCSAARTIRRLLLGMIVLLGVVSTATAMRHFGDGRVEPHGRMTHALHVGLEDYWLTIHGNGITDLACRVYDRRGALVDSDTSDADRCILETPLVGAHRLDIRNLGDETNHYTIRQRVSPD